MQAQNAEARGDTNGARRNRNVALFLNVAAVLVFVICIIVVSSSYMKSGGYYHWNYIIYSLYERDASVYIFMNGIWT